MAQMSWMPRSSNPPARRRSTSSLSIAAGVPTRVFEKALGAGMNDHIGKPINVREMFITMAKWITPGETGTRSAGQALESNETVISLPELPGIDTTAGLAITQGNEKLYRKLLLKFRDGQRDFEANFKAALVSDDPDEAGRVAHTLKGVAGNIAANELRAAASELEQACRNEIEDVSELLEAVLAALEPVIEGLETLDEAAG